MTEPESMELTIKNKLGLHARAAAKLVRVADAYRSAIRLVKDGEAADARSILSLISLGCAAGCRIVVEAEGEDARSAVSAIGQLIETGFGEE